MIDTRTKAVIVKSYLGRFAVPVDKKEREYLTPLLDVKEDLILKGSATWVKKAIAVYLMMNGRQFYKYRTTYDTVSLYLGKEEDVDFVDVDTAVLIVEHCKGTMENKQLEPLNRHLVIQRKNAGLRTLFIPTSPLSTIEDLFKVIHLLVILLFPPSYELLFRVRLSNSQKFRLHIQLQTPLSSQ